MNNHTKYRLAGELDTTISGKLLYLLLLDTSDADGCLTIRQRHVGSALGICKGTVSRNLRRLERAGAISITPTFHSDGGRAANKYIIN